MKMGSCFSCCRNDDDDDDHGGSRRNDEEALIDPADNVSPVSIPRSDSVTVGTTAAAQIQSEEDELAKILQETASAMIDVSTTSGSHSTIDQREFQDRTKNYLQRIQKLNPNLLLMPPHSMNQTTAELMYSSSPFSNNSNASATVTDRREADTKISTSGAPCFTNLLTTTATSGYPTMLLADVPNPEKHLRAELISDEDKELMSFALDEIEDGLQSIRVSYDGDLVVPFGSDYSAASSSSPLSDTFRLIS